MKLKPQHTGITAFADGQTDAHTAATPPLSQMRRILKPALAVACSLIAGFAASAQDYHSNDITPAGSNSGKLNAASGGKQVGGSQVTNSYSPHACLISGNALTAVDLNPATAYYSMATCLDDSQQGGWAYLPVGIHALVWSGSSDSYSDLNPSGYNFSYCLGLHSGEQVGYAQQQSYFISASHAYCWRGTATSGVDLHPVTAYVFSRAVACHDGEEVGYVSNIAYPEGEYLSYHNVSHAMRWAGTAASAVDLNPAGFDASEATCTSGTQQGGWGYIALSTSHLHALLWSGTAASAVDLHPLAYSETRINAMNADKQVGDGWVGTPGVVGSVRHALAWSGTADSVVDLNQYLPAGYTNGVATGIDAQGNIVGYAYNIFQAGVSVPQGAIAVVFAPGAAPAAQLTSVALSSGNVAPGATVQGSVALSTPAPAGGVNVTFLSTNTALAATPAAVAIPEGESSASFSLPIGGSTLTAPASVRIYATDGTVSQYSSVTVTPVVKLSTILGNAVEGGFSTYGTIFLSIPAQTGGAVVSLTSGDASLLAVPATITIPQGYQSYTFTMNTGAVATTTNVALSASFNGTTATGSVSISAAPVVSLATITLPEVVGGQSVTGTITMNNFSRNLAGSVISLTSNNAFVQVPATVTVPYGTTSATFTATTSIVPASKAVTVQASYNGSSLSATTSVLPVPTVTILSADWDPVTLLFKVVADTSYANSVLTFGTDAASGPIGTMQFELGQWKGSILMPTFPTTATVWNSNGGQASMAVTNKGVKASGGGGGGGGSTTTSTTYKLSTSTTGKGTIAISPSGTTFAAGTVVTLTATPAAGSPWVGWSGGVVSKSQTITITMTKAISVTANFK